jgi:hypothetical protein
LYIKVQGGTKGVVYRLSTTTQFFRKDTTPLSNLKILHHHNFPKFTFNLDYCQIHNSNFILRLLKKLGLISGEKGKFQINPQIFWKGDTKTRREKNEELKITFSFS